MPLIATRGASSVQGFGQFAQSAIPNYIEEVFSTYLYTGNGTSQTITNNIDLSTNDGLVWLKSRSNAQYHGLWDTLRGPTHALNSGLTNGEYTTTSTQDLTGFTSSGFTVGTYWNNSSNQNGATYASWTFREQPKFFDIVTFTKSSSSQVISHNLNSTAGCIFIKRTDSTGGWLVAHRGYTGGITAGYTLLNATNAFTSSANAVTAADSTSFTLGSDVANGDFVAYLFAHDAGGFGLTGTDNVISCGSFSTDSGGKATVNLGYEPQWVMFKRTDSSTFGDWYMIDNMRGFTNPSGSSWLWANTTGVEQTGINFAPESTGFNINFTGPADWIYIAIRRGPMKVPTLSTSVFTPIARTGTGSDTTITGVGFAPDMLLAKSRPSNNSGQFYDRLRGLGATLYAQQNNAELSLSTTLTGFDAMDGVRVGTEGFGHINTSFTQFIHYFFKRAPSFFDEVCYTGTGSVRTVAHNLTVAPQLIIWKQRSATSNWVVYGSSVGMGYLLLNQVDSYQADSSALFMNNTTPTASVFTVGSDAGHSNPKINASGATYVAYLFATCAGISKVGSYTGTGTTLQIDCGFTAGARFVLIKRTDSTGDWYVWDTVRGIISGNDPYLLLNTVNVEVTNTDYIDTYNAGFELSSTAPAAINANAGTYIFLAIA